MSTGLALAILEFTAWASLLMFGIGVLIFFGTAGANVDAREKLRNAQRAKRSADRTFRDLSAFGEE